MKSREDVKAELARTALLTFEYNGTSTLDGDAVLKIIDELFDDFEKEIKDRNNEYFRMLSRTENE